MFANLSPGAIGIRTDLAGSVALAARHGWVGCDLPAGEAARLAAERSVDEVAAIFAQAGVRPGGWGLPINWREPYDQAALTTLAEQAAVAAQLGCTRSYTWLMPASNDRPFRENFAFHVAQLRPIAQVLAEHGCQLGLEFIGPRTMRESHRYGFIYSPEAMLGLAEAIGPNAGLLLDCWHWYTAVGAAADIRTLRAEDIVYVHVNDAPTGVAVEAQIDQVRQLPGATGVIDIAGFLQALREIGYDGPVTPEPFDKQLAARPADESCKIARDAMRKIWQVAGLEAA
jgi:sugar phosphate isomerase/epimerase